MGLTDSKKQILMGTAATGGADRAAARGGDATRAQ